MDLNLNTWLTYEALSNDRDLEISIKAIYYVCVCLPSLMYPPSMVMVIELN